MDGHLYLLEDLKDSLANINCSPQENESEREEKSNRQRKVKEDETNKE